MGIARLLPPHAREGLPPPHTASARILLRLLFILLVDQFPLDAHEQKRPMGGQVIPRDFC